MTTIATLPAFEYLFFQLATPVQLVCPIESLVPEINGEKIRLITGRYINEILIFNKLFSLELQICEAMDQILVQHDKMKT